MKEHAKMFSKENISQTFKNREKVFVALKGNRIVGTAGLEAAWSKNPGEYWVLTVFIEPEYQGQGIGRKLIEKVEEYAKSIEAKKLVVPASITGNEFYYKLGYTYKDNKKELNEEKMYIMEKIL
jgi:GNAT superfamily N-acetyltransferase